MNKKKAIVVVSCAITVLVVGAVLGAVYRHGANKEEEFKRKLMEKLGPGWYGLEVKYEDGFKKSVVYFKTGETTFKLGCNINTTNHNRYLCASSSPANTVSPWYINIINGEYTENTRAMELFSESDRVVLNLKTPIAFELLTDLDNAVNYAAR